MQGLLSFQGASNKNGTCNISKCKYCVRSTVLNELFQTYPESLLYVVQLYNRG